MAELALRSPDEPHRQLMLLAAERLVATRRRDADLGYPGPAELLADLRMVQASLAEAGAPRLAYGELQHLIWQVETFGFHLAELEVRQHSAVHATALEEVRAGGARSAATQEVLGDAAGDGGPAAAVRRRRVPPLRRQLHPVGGRHRRGLRAGGGGDGRAPTGPGCGAALRDRRRPGGCRWCARRCAGAAGGAAPARADRSAAGGDARLLRLGQGRRPGHRDVRPVRRAGALAQWARPQPASC